MRALLLSMDPAVACEVLPVEGDLDAPPERLRDESGVLYVRLILPRRMLQELWNWRVGIYGREGSPDWISLKRLADDCFCALATVDGLMGSRQLEVTATRYRVFYLRDRPLEEVTPVERRDTPTPLRNPLRGLSWDEWLRKSAELLAEHGR